MEIKDFFDLISRKRPTIISWVVLFLVLAVLFTAIQPLKYGSSEKLLVVQNYVAGSDPYSFSRSNEYLSNILAEVVTSNSFFTKIMDSGYKINKDYFAGNTKEKMKMWTKTVNARAISDTGIIEISVYHPDRGQAEQIALAIGYVMKTAHQYYHGSGDEVTVKVIDDPITSNWPTKPNIILNISLAIVLGFIFGLSYSYLLPEERYDFRLWRKRAKKAAMIQVVERETRHEPEVAEVRSEKAAVEQGLNSGVQQNKRYDEFADGNINNLF